MVFPERERVIYRDTPLIEVLCEVRFPKIDRINNELPSEFQNRIRERYPILNVQNVTEVQIQAGPIPQHTVKKNVYQFLTESQVSAVSINQESFSFAVAKYDRWEKFQGEMFWALQHFIEVYHPGEFRRIGLRYKDVIVPSLIGFSGRKWRELLNPSIAGVLAPEDALADSVTASHGGFTVTLPGGGFVVVNHSMVENSQTKDRGYMIDCDVHTEETTEASVDAARQRLVKFNEQAGRAFRWCISDDVHEALGPQRIHD